MHPGSRAQGCCYCGGVTLTVPLPLRRPINCHCGQCRRLSGAAFTTWITVARDLAEIRDAELLREFAPTPNLRRFFCGRCGTHVFTADARLPRALGVPAGVFEGQAIETPTQDFFVADKAAWYAIAPGSPCFGGAPGTEPVDLDP